MEDFINSGTEDRTQVSQKDTQEKLDPQKAWKWYKGFNEKAETFKKEARIDCAYYDGDQYTREEKETLRDRKQPALVINRTKPTIDLVLGTEVKSKVEFHAAPRSGDHVDDADIITHCLKHAMDQNKGEFLCSKVFGQLIKAGWGFLEAGENEDPFADKIKISFVPRDEMFWDTHSTQYDLEDGRFIGRKKWVDLEDAIEMFPNEKDFLTKAVSSDDGEESKDNPYHGTEDQADRPGVSKWDISKLDNTEWTDTDRKRVLFLEVRYKVSSKIWVMINDLTGDVQEFDPEQHMGMLSQPLIRFEKRSIKKVRFAIICGNKTLVDAPSPYEHNRWGFIPFWGYLSDKDNAPYGPGRQIRDPQDEINKRRSKAMHLLNSRQFFYEDGALDPKGDDEKAIAEKLSKPDSVMKFARGALSGGKIKVEYGLALVEAQYKFEEEAKGEIEAVSGVFGELKGEQTNATSGKAIIARASQGNTMLGILFENYRQSRQILGEILFALVQQFYTQPMVVRITGKTGGYEFIEINQYVQHEGRVFIKNDITKAKADIVIDEEVFHATIRQAMLEQMLQMVGSLPPEIGLALLDLVVSYSDLPMKDEMVKRIQMVQGAMAQMAQNQINLGGQGQPVPPGGNPVSQEPSGREAQAIASQMFGG